MNEVNEENEEEDEVEKDNENNEEDDNVDKVEQVIVKDTSMSGLRLRYWANDGAWALDTI